jgi:hypothetical protein
VGTCPNQKLSLHVDSQLCVMLTYHEQTLLQQLTFITGTVCGEVHGNVTVAVRDYNGTFLNRFQSKKRFCFS